MACSAFGFDVEPVAVSELWIRRAAANGVTGFGSVIIRL